jgi:hypothetical protein
MDYKMEFLRQTALFNAIGAAFQRARIYSENATPEMKYNLKRDLGSYLCNFENQYRSITSSQAHFENIETLANNLSQKHGTYLKDGNFRIGVAQKALNIYLKLIWCYGWIPEPPHCPVDSIVLAEIGDTKTKWTKMTELRAYQNAIESIRFHIHQYVDGKSLPQWELEIWTKRTKSSE